MTINSISDFRKAIRNGAYAWPGGYPRYFLLADGEALSFNALKERSTLMCVLSALRDRWPGDEQWLPVAVEINWEDGDLFCAHTGERIESAYAGPDEPVT